MANLNTFKHRLGDRTYENRFTRDRPMSGADTDRRTQVAQMELENAAREGAQVIDLSKGPGAVTTSPAVYEGDDTGSKGVLRRESADILPELRPLARQAVTQGYRRLAGIGQAWQGSSPGDRLVVNSEGMELGVGDIVHYPGGQGRGGGSKDAYTAVVVRIETKRDRPEGESGFENVRAKLQRLDPDTGEVIGSDVKGTILQVPDDAQFNRFQQLAKSEAALSLLADRPEPGKRSKERNTELKDALEQAQRTGTIFSEPGAKRRSGAGREDRRLPDANGALIRRGDYVRTPEGAIGRVTYIEEPDEEGVGGRAYIELPHAQTYPRLAGSKLERLHDANNDVMIDAVFHNGGVFMPTREEAAQALDRLGVGRGAVRDAVMDPSSTGESIKRAMRSDPGFMESVEQGMVPTLEQRNKAMAVGKDPDAGVQRAMQDWDAVLSASAGYFRDPADPLPAPAPESLRPPSPSPDDPADPQDPSNPTKAITPGGERVDAPTPPPAPEQQQGPAIGDRIAEGLARAREQTRRMMSRGVQDPQVLPVEFAALDDAVRNRDAGAFYSALDAMQERMADSPRRYANTPIKAVVVDGRNSNGEPLAPYLREKYGSTLFQPQAQAPAPVEERPTPEADTERPPDIDRSVDELNNSLSEKLLAEGSARVVDGDGNVLAEGFAVIRPGPDSRASFDEAPTPEEIEGFIAGNAVEGDTALAAWQSGDGTWNLGVVDLAPDKETAHEIATDADGSGQYIDISDGMVYNAVPTDSAADDVIDDRSRERGTRPSPDGGSAELIGATDRQKEIIGQAASADPVPDGVRDTLQRMATGTGTFTAEEVGAAVDWLKKASPSDIWSPEEYTARQRNGLKAAVLNLAKRLSEDSGASDPDPYPSKATAERRSREVAQLLTNSFDRLDLDDDAMQSLVGAIASARELTRHGRYTDAADVFRGLATAYETASGQDGHNARVAPRARLHADRLAGAQKDVPARRMLPSPAQLDRLSFISRIEPHLGSTAAAREVRALAERARRESLEGAPTAGRTIRELEQKLRDNPGTYRAGVEGAAASRWQDLTGDDSIGDPADATDLEQLDRWRRNTRDFVDTYADAGDDGVVGDARSLLDGFDDEENRILADLRGGPDEHEASAREADDAARSAAEAITPESVADRSDEELDALGERLAAESEGTSHSPETDEALDRAAEAVSAERASRSEPSVLTDEQRGAVERASGDLSDLDDAELESLRDELRAVRSALPDDIDEETADRVDGAVDRVEDEIADRLDREVYDEEPVESSTEPSRATWTEPGSVRLERRAAGFYEAQVGPGLRDRYEIRRQDREWFLTYPGATRPDDVYSSLGEAKQAFIEHYRNLWDGLEGGTEAPDTGMPAVSDAPAEGGLAGLNELYRRFMDRDVPMAESVRGSQAAQGIGDWATTGRAPARFNAWLRDEATPEQVRDLFDRVRSDPDFGDTVGSAWDVLRKYDSEGSLIPSAGDEQDADRVLPEEQRDAIDSGDAETPQRLEESLPEPVEDVLAGDDTVYAELDEVVELITRLDDEDFEPTLQQKRIIAAVQSGKNVVVRAMAGTGKALRHDQPVLTPSGFRPIGTLLPGDPVMGRDGLQYEVQGVYPQGERELFTVTFSDGTSVVADADHRWFVQRLDERYAGLPGKVRTTAEIACKLRTPAAARGGSGSRAYWFMPMVEPLKFDPTDVPLDPWLFGALLGDGTLHGSVTFSSTDSEIMDRVTELVAPMGIVPKLNPSSRAQCDYRLTTRQVRPGHRGFYNPVVAALRSVGAWDKRSQEHRIPDVYRMGDIDTRVAVLQGLFDTDGSPKRAGRGVHDHQRAARP